MMTMILDRLTALGDDVLFSIDDDGTIHATLQDFEGFDEHWREIEREFDDEDAVDAFLEWCEETADSYTADIASDYHFGDITLWVCYASADI